MSNKLKPMRQFTSLELYKRKAPSSLNHGMLSRFECCFSSFFLRLVLPFPSMNAWDEPQATTPKGHWPDQPDARIRCPFNDASSGGVKPDEKAHSVPILASLSQWKGSWEASLAKVPRERD